MKTLLVRKCIRVPKKFAQFIQDKADKQALIDGKKTNWTRALLAYNNEEIKRRDNRNVSWNNEELKPCPFCGGKAENQLLDAGTIDACQPETNQVFCDACNATLIKSGEGDDAAIKVWNTRVSF